MTPVELQIAKAILIENDPSLTDFEFVALPQADGIAVVGLTPTGEVETLDKLRLETVCYYSVVRTPRKRICQTHVTFYRDRTRKVVYVARKADTLVQTLNDQVRAAVADAMSGLD